MRGKLADVQRLFNMLLHIIRGSVHGAKGFECAELASSSARGWHDIAMQARSDPCDCLKNSLACLLHQSSRNGCKTRKKFVLTQPFSRHKGLAAAVLMHANSLCKVSQGSAAKRGAMGHQRRISTSEASFSNITVRPCP